MEKISTIDYNRILTVVGYPVVSEEDLEISKADILEFIIEPAVRQYYTWFPIRNIQSFMIGSSIGEYKFPTDATFGVLDVRLNPQNTGYGRTSSPFLNSLNFQQNSARRYGTRNDYGFLDADIVKRSWDISRASQLRSVRFEVDANSRLLRVFSNDVGELVITWAETSDDFDEIPWNRKEEVINLAQAGLLRFLAMVRGQITVDVGGTEFDTGILTERANALEEKVMTKWKALSKVVVLRG